MTVVGLEPKAGPGRVRRWLMPALIASLALNLLVVGMLGGAVWRFRHGSGNPNGQGASLLGYVSTLPAARRDALIASVGDPRLELRPLRQEQRTARAEFAAALAAEPFDRARVIAAQKRAFDAETAVRGAAQRLAGELALKLSPEDLRAYSRWRPHPRGGRGEDGEEGGGGRPRR